MMNFKNPSTPFDIFSHPATLGASAAWGRGYEEKEMERLI